ncbi:MAG: efflux RND transporter periplasmic adaptor subunit [Candidatus Latescibacterota bacterium]|nr:MAG: efflux RND transporter periplasmic adaptor subunit [Candidatus Latescibacterota bacterium]
MKKVFWLMIITLCIAGDVAWSQQKDEHDEPGRTGDPSLQDEHGHEEGRTVKLTPEELHEFGIEVDVAGGGVIRLFLSLPGEIRPNADRLAHIVPRFPGIVTEVYAQLGDRVKKGQTLATIESDESLAPFQVKTLISGTVISKHITLGEAVSRERDTYVIADLRTVWVDVTLYQRDLERVRIGQTATIYVGHRRTKDNGVISYITPVVDETTRTATARVVLANEHERWRPGMFVTAEIEIERFDADVAIPKTALQTLDDHTVVFVEADGAFEAREITVGRAGRELVEVLAGLRPGERYVSSGGFTLKAELGKEAFGEGHGH